MAAMGIEFNPAKYQLLKPDDEQKFEEYISEDNVFSEQNKKFSSETLMEELAYSSMDIENNIIRKPRRERRGHKKNYEETRYIRRRNNDKNFY